MLVAMAVVMTVVVMFTPVAVVIFVEAFFFLAFNGNGEMQA
jgi:hypothetical protein